jgi:hypothetical protein
MRIDRRCVLLGLTGLAPALSLVARGAESDDSTLRKGYRRRTPSTEPAPVLLRHGLVAKELRRWRVREANQAAAVDAEHFYGIGNDVLVKHRKDTGERVAKWTSPRGGSIVHFNSGYVDGDRLVLAHSNFPRLPPVSSLETHDARTLQPIASHSLGVRPGSLTWAVRHKGSWWACFAFYNRSGSLPGYDQRSTYLGEFDDRWQMLRSWQFPPQVIATWGASSCSGGDWGDDELLYTTGHDAPELHVLRLPRQGVTLEHVTTIDVPFEGQGWAWDRTARGRRIIYGISRAQRQVIAAEIPALPAQLQASLLQSTSATHVKSA